MYQINTEFERKISSFEFTVGRSPVGHGQVVQSHLPCFVAVGRASQGVNSNGTNLYKDLDLLIALDSSDKRCKTLQRELLEEAPLINPLEPAIECMS